MPPLWSREESLAFYRSSEWKQFRRKWLDNCGLDACEACNKPIDINTGDATLDHIVAVSKAPHMRMDPQNIALLCRSCNGRKQNRSGVVRQNYVNTKLVRL